MNSGAAMSFASARSIAVLAFDDLSPEGDQAYFAEGISEELLNLLARIDDFKVAARTSSFKYKGGQSDIGEIGPLLGCHGPVATRHGRPPAATGPRRTSPTVAGELPADGARRPVHGFGNRPDRQPSLQQELDMGPFIDPKMLIGRIHANTLTSSMCCTSI